MQIRGLFRAMFRPDCHSYLSHAVSNDIFPVFLKHTHAKTVKEWKLKLSQNIIPKIVSLHWFKMYDVNKFAVKTNS